MRAPIRNGPLGFVAAACLAASLAGPARALDFSVSPYWAEAGKPATVALSMTSGLCDPRFSHQAVSVEGAKILVSVLAENDPLARCADTLRTSHTDFDLPALKAGEYAVSVLLPPACAFTAPLCPYAYSPQPAGTLMVSDAAALAFSFLPKRAASQKPFNLQLANKQFLCRMQYLDVAASVSGHAIYLQYAIAPTTIDTGCPANSVHGPVFAMAGLAAGTYQVMAAPKIYCKPGGPCPLALIAPQLAGALQVGDTSATALAPRSAGAPRPALAGASGSPRAGTMDRRPGQVRMPWHAGTTGLTGRLE